MSQSIDTLYLHPQSHCESKTVGTGTRIWAHAHVMPKAVIGSHCNLGEQVFVENGVRVGNHCTLKNGVALWEGLVLEDHVFIGPYAVFTNDFSPRAFHTDWKERGFRPTLIKRGATIGANATLLCGLTIGEFAMVGAGSVVTQNVAPHALIVGVPGKPIGRVCYCGKRLDSSDFCNACHKPLSENSLELILAAAKDPLNVKG